MHVIGQRAACIWAKADTYPPKMEVLLNRIFRRLPNLKERIRQRRRRLAQAVKHPKAPWAHPLSATYLQSNGNRAVSLTHKHMVKGGSFKGGSHKGVWWGKSRVIGSK